MKGNNELLLNEATVIEALQEYLTARYTKPIAVQSVKQSGSGYESVFKVTVSEPEKGQTPDAA